MAKSKTIWEWRGSTFSSKKEVLAHLAQRAREAVEGVLGPPVAEVRGDDRQTYSVKLKVQVSLGVWPPRRRKLPSPAAASAATGKRQRLKPLSKAAVRKDLDEYF